MSASLQLSVVYLRRRLFCWIVVVPALSLLIAFIADRAGLIALILLMILLLAILLGMIFIIFALLEGDLAPHGLFVLCPLVLATTSLLLGMGGYAVLRGERVDAVVDKVSKHPAESSVACGGVTTGCWVVGSSEASMRIDQLSDPATKEVFGLARAPGFSRPNGLLNDGRSSYSKYEVGDRVPVLAVRGSDHPAVTVGSTSHVTVGAVIWLGAWLIGLVCVVVSLWPEGQRRRISGSRT